jgi:twitching motility protein PilT
VEQLIRAAVDRGARSLMIKAGDVLRARIDDDLIKLSKTAFTPDETRAIALRIIDREDIRENIDELNDYDCAWSLEDCGRFRVNILRQRGSLMVVLRRIPGNVPTVNELQLPPVLEDIADAEDGLILVTGATGSGKSTTQAAMVGWINRNRRKHIVTLEDPIEYLHEDHQSTITQRDVGSDTESFARGLRQSLRQDPDVILIGEMRDPDTIDTALKAAATGHLVISTLHSPTAVASLGRLLAVFAEEERDLVRMRLGDVLRAVIGQRLVARTTGQGLIAAIEIMRVTGAVRDCILMSRPVEKIVELMQDGKDQYGMQTFDQHLMELVRTGLVEYSVARAAATSPSDFELVMQTLATDETGNGTPTPNAGSLLEDEAFQQF